MKYFNILLLLNVFSAVYVHSRRVIPLGVLIDESRSQSLIALMTRIYANNLIHQSIDYRMKLHTLPDDSFESSKIICNISETKNGVAAIVTSIPSRRSDIVESICAEFEIPHIQLLWNAEPTISPLTSLNFYPDLELFADGLAAVVKSLQWKSFVVLYEDEFSLIKLKYVLKLEPSGDEKTWNNIKLKKLGSGPDYRGVLKDIKYIPESNILLDCRTDKIYDILEQAQSVRMLEIFHSYFITSLDTHTVNLTALNYKANITTIRIFQPESKPVKQAIQDYELTEHNFLKSDLKYDPYEIKTSTVLMHDGIDHLIGVINDLSANGNIKPTTLSCAGNEKSDTGYRIVSFMKVKPPENALTSPIQFDKNGTRIDFNIYLIKGTGNNTLNIWRAQNQNLITNRTQKEYEKDVEEMLRGEEVTIASRIVIPYLMYKEGHEKLVGNDKYEGYAMDLIKAMAKIAGFEFNFKIVSDNTLGTYNPVLAQWNGLMGEITEHKAHMAISDLAMTAERQQVVDFSSPFMNLGIGLLIKKPTEKEIPLFAFLDPFTQDVWAYTATLLLALFVVFFLAYRLAPNEWVNPHPCDRNPDELEIEWTFNNCVWLVLGALLQQGCDILPRSLSTRLALALWWFFSLIMFNSYTANLAAFLTTEKSGVTVKNVEELAKQTVIKYGCMEYGDTYYFFKNSDYSTYRKMWNNMVASNNPSLFVKTDNEGVQRVLSTKNSLYAYLTESTIIDYETKTNECKLKSAGNWLNTISFAIATPMNAGYLGIINSAILNLSESGELDKLKERWWKTNRKEKICEEERTTAEDKSLQLERVAGVFIVVGIGIVLGHLVAIIEFLWNVKTVAVEEKMSYREALRHELKFVINFKLHKKRTKHKMIPAVSTEGLKNTTLSNRNKNLLDGSGSLFNLNKINVPNEVSKKD